MFEDPRAIDVLVQHLDKGTGASLEGMAALAAERLIEEMLDRDATIQTLTGALVVLKEVQALPKGSLTKVRTALRVELPVSELPQLRTLADTHRRESTRLAAARAVSTITGEPLEAAPLRCPSVHETNGSTAWPSAIALGP